MQKNLTSKKRAYLSLTLLLSCAVSSAYGMQGVKSYLSGWKNYLTGVRNDNQNSDLESESESDTESYSESESESDTEIEEELEDARSNQNSIDGDLQLALPNQVIPEQVEQINIAQGSLPVSPVLPELPDNGAAVRLEQSRLEPSERAKFLAKVHERRIARSNQEASNVAPIIELPWREAENNNGEHGEVGQPVPQLNVLANDNNVIELPLAEIENNGGGVGQQPAPRLNMFAKAMDKARNNKGRIAAGVGVAAVGVGGYVLRKPIARLYQRAKLNAQDAWQKLQNKRVTRGAALKGALGLAGTAATAYAAHTVYQNPDAARDVLSNRKAQLGTLGALATIAGTKLAYNYLTKRAVEQPDAHAADACALMIEEFIATFTEEQWNCPGVSRAIEAFAQGNVALGTEILVGNSVKLSNIQEQKLQDILDTMPS